MGVSERTIWRRIKSDNIESRSENGRTLVQLEEPDPATDPMRQLSNVAVAQLSMRKLDAETMADVMTVLSDYRSSFDREIARARRAARSGMVLAVTLLLAVSAGAVYHLQLVRGIKDRQDATINEKLALAEAEHQKGVSDLKVAVTGAEKSAQTRAEDLDKFRQDQREQFTQLAREGTQRDTLHASTNERLADLNKTLDATSTRAAETAAESSQLRDQIAMLNTQLGERTLAVEQHQRQADRVNEALRRSAAQSNGLAAGLRIFIARQDEQLRRMQAELEALRPQVQRERAAEGQSSNAQHDALLKALVELNNKPAAAPAPARPINSESLTWSPALKQILEEWIAQYSQADPTDNLASAD
jgi:hypothetical protein